MKHPDRFERMVYEHNGLDSNWMRAVDVIDLLRREHRWMERMMKQHCIHLPDKEVLLDQLKQRRR